MKSKNIIWDEDLIHSSKSQSRVFPLISLLWIL